MLNNRLVLPSSPHRHSSRGDSMADNKILAATYKMGKTTVRVYEPETITEEEKAQILLDHHLAGWAIWNSLTDEQKEAINAEYEKKGSQ